MKTAEPTLEMDDTSEAILQDNSHQLVKPSDNNEDEIHSYYRSRVITVETGLNPLATAASAVFSIISKLGDSDYYSEKDSLLDFLIHEISSFKTNAETLGYRSEAILIARYLLCATIDDIIKNTHWGRENNWKDSSLLWRFHQETTDEDRFFFIIEHLIKFPILHIDLLEVAYLCLSLGYEGKYHKMDKGHIKLEGVIDSLYRCIREFRGGAQRPLLTSDKHVHKQQSSKQRFPLWLIPCVLVFLLSVIYFGFGLALDLTSKPLYHHIDTIYNSIESPHEDI